MEQVPIARVIDGEQEPQDPVLVPTAAEDVIGESRRITGAVADGRRAVEGGRPREESRGGAKTGDGREVEEQGDEGRGAEGE